MTEGHGFIIVRDCKNVNMNQKSLRIVLVSVSLFLVDIMLDVLPIKRIWYKLFVVIYFKDRLTIKSINITINRYTRTHVLASLSALISLAYMGANKFCQVSDSDSSRLESHFLCLDSSRDSKKLDSSLHSKCLELTLKWVDNYSRHSSDSSHIRLLELRWLESCPMTRIGTASPFIKGR